MSFFAFRGLLILPIELFNWSMYFWEGNISSEGSVICIVPNELSDSFVHSGKDFSNIKRSELVNQSKRGTIIHILRLERNREQGES